MVTVHTPGYSQLVAFPVSPIEWQLSPVIVHVQLQPITNIPTVNSRGERTNEMVEFTAQLHVGLLPRKV